MTDAAAHYLEEARRQLRGHKRMGEGAMSQLSDQDFFVTLDPEANSIAILVKHIAGNMRSRFTDFLTSDGEKANRFRDREFELSPATTRAEVMTWWEEGWTCVFNAIDPPEAGGCHAYGHHQGRAPHRSPGDQSPDRPLRAAHRPDRISGQASALQSVEDSEHPAGKIGGV